MKTSLTKRWIIFGLMALFSLALLAVYGIPLGLDLKGGKRFVLVIDEEQLEENIVQNLSTNKMDKAEFDEIVEEQKTEASKQILTVIRNRIDQSGTKEPNVFEQKVGKERRIVVELPGVKDEDVEGIEELLTRQAILEFRGVDLKNDELTQSILDGENVPPGYKVVNRKQGSFEGRYLKPLSAKEWLEDASAMEKFGITGSTVDEVQLALDNRNVKKAIRESTTSFKRTAKSDLLLQPERIEDTGELLYSPTYVEVQSRMGGQGVKNARTEIAKGAPEVILEFEGDARRQWGDVTTLFAPNGEASGNRTDAAGRSIGRQLGVVLDGTLYSAPVIRQPILGGVASISGNFTQKEADQLSLVLRAGAFPAPVEIERNTTISPSLGKDAIRSGATALLIGSIFILLFMLFYYHLAGVAVNLALIADVLLLPLGMFVAGGVLSIFSHQPGAGTSAGLPVLTLPGIAGLVLVIGMAVDANVLIFERIREEQAAGKRFVSAVVGGFDKAFSTILDANVTTMIVAIILYIYGSGPIRGFAVTLTAGILVSVYTALIFTRMIFDHLAQNPKRERVSMLSIMKNANYDFLSKRKLAAIVSIAVIGLSWILFAVKGADNFGIDFRGGRSVQYTIAQGELPEVGAVRKALGDKGIKDATILVSKGSDGSTLDLRLPAAEGVDLGGLKKDNDATIAAAPKDPILDTLKGAFPGLAFKQAANDVIGPQIGSELRRKGLISLLLALIGIVIYISFRFEFAFAMGAIAALVHDVAITIGLFCLFGAQLSAPIIAALLTVVGYSVNDTIVVFDRIREDWLLDKQGDRATVANLAINRTLSRTILTSVTTLITVVMLLLFGGGAIRDFALCLTIGVLIGTYSSVFVATPVMLFFKKRFAERAAPAPASGKKATA